MVRGASSPVASAYRYAFALTLLCLGMPQAMVVTNAPASAPAAPAQSATTTATTPAAGVDAGANAATDQGTGKGGQGISRGPDGKFAPKAEAKAEPAKEPEAKPSKVKLLNGKELDLEDVIRLATKQAAGEDKFRAAAEKEKELAETDNRIKALFAAMDQDPDGFAAELTKIAKARGVSPEKLATKMLQPLIDQEMAAIEEKSLTPEQLEARKLKRELEELKRAKADEEAQAKKAAEAKALEEHQAKAKALESAHADKVLNALKASGLPQTDANALALVNIMKDLHVRGFNLDDIPAEALAGELRDMQRANVEKWQEASEDTSWVSPKVREAIRKEEVAKLKEKNVFANAKPISGRAKAEAKPEEPKTRSMDAIKRDLMMGIGVRKPA